MADNPPPPQETLEQMQARHRKEAKDLQGRITSKKKNATKKARKGVNDECAELERQMRERQAEEVRQLQGAGDTTAADEEEGRDGSDGDDGDDDVAAKMGALNVEEEGDGAPARIQQPPPAAPSSARDDEENNNGGGGGANGGGGGKKRNRQKERLARRAAEQEAAAAAAEREAAGMTDHRGAERARMTAEFARRGLVEREIRPDGHCLFSAVADQLGAVGIPTTSSNSNTRGAKDGKDEAKDAEENEGKNNAEPGYKTVRRRAAGYIEAHGDEYAGFLEEDLGAYVRKMRDTAEWGGQLELLALASVYGVEICVVQAGGVEVVQPATRSGNGTGKGEGEGEERKKIWLAYYRHGYGLGEHYNSLRQKA